MPRAKMPTIEPTDDSRAVDRTLEVIGSTWTAQIVCVLLGGPLRFGQVQQALGYPSSKTIADRLRDLEGRGLVTRTQYREIPPRVEYALTDEGRTLEPIIVAMAAWGAGRVSGVRRFGA